MTSFLRYESYCYQTIDYENSATIASINFNPLKIGLLLQR